MDASGDTSTPEMIDLEAATVVEIVQGRAGELWVKVDGSFRLRVRRVSNLHLVDLGPFLAGKTKTTFVTN